MFVELVKLAFPLAATFFFTALIGVVDMYFAGFLGPQAQAAVGLADQLLMIWLLVGTGLATGTAVCVSRFEGSGNKGIAAAYANVSTLSALFIGLIAACGSYAIAPVLLKHFGIDNADAHSYLQLCSPANMPFILSLVLSAILRSRQQGLKCLAMSLITSVISISLSYIFFWTPQLPTYKTLASLAWAWDIGAFVGTSIGFWWVLPYLRSALPSKSKWLIKRLLMLNRIALPAVLSEACFVISNLALTQFIMLIDDDTISAQAAWFVVLKLEETVIYIPALGIALATTVLISHSLGSRKKDAVWQVLQASALLTVAWSGCTGVLMSFSTAAVAACFHVTGAAFGSLTSFLQLAPILMPLLALSTVLGGALDGASDTTAYLRANIIARVIVRIVVAYVAVGFAGLGMQGIWVALLVSRLVLFYCCGSSVLERFAPTIPWRVLPGGCSSLGGSS